MEINTKTGVNMISKETIEEEIKFYKHLRQKCIREKSKLRVNGKIYFRKEHGHIRPYTKINGKYKYLNQSHLELICKLTNKHELQETIKCIDNNLTVLGNMKDKIVDLANVVPKNITFSKDGRSKEAIALQLDKWAERAGDANSYFEKRRVLITSDGTCVRSKSELIIYEFLLSKGVKFLYEDPIIVGGRTRYPDFKILRESDGKIILWEHFGMMELPEYERDASAKINEYTKAGYWPMDNLICTYDFGDGNIDMLALERIIKTMGII